MHPFTQDTYSYMGEMSESTATLHMKQRWSNKIAATLPEGALGEGGNMAAPTPAASTPCSADVKGKAWTMASESPSV